MLRTANPILYSQRRLGHPLLGEHWPEILAIAIGVSMTILALALAAIAQP